MTSNRNHPTDHTQESKPSDGYITEHETKLEEMLMMANSYGMQLDIERSRQNTPKKESSTKQL